MPAPFNIEQHLNLQGERLGNLNEDQKFALLVLAYYSGKSSRALIKDFKLNIGHVTITCILKQYEESGSLLKPERWGRRTLYDKKLLERLEKFIMRSGVTRRMSYQAIKMVGQFPGSVRRIRRACRKLGFRKCIPRVKKLISEHQQAIRYIWALDHLKWTTDDWERIIWTDESSFSSAHLAYNVCVLRRLGEEYHPDCVQKQRYSGRESVMVWGAFCSTTKSKLHVVQGKVS